MNSKLIAYTFLFLSLVTTHVAFAEVLIAPTRIVLEDGQRSSELVIVNKGSEEAAFRISIENRRMKLDGSLETVVDQLTDELFAKEFVRFSPRRVVMKPGERQTIRVSVNTANLAPGEYRSHLRLMSAPTSAGRTLASASGSTGGDLSIQLIAIRSLTIPVIARVGKLDAEVTLDSAALKNQSHANGNTMLEANLSRTGTRSSYGDLEIFSADQDKPVYYARGIAVYTPNKERIVKLPLPDDVAEKLSGQSTRIVYRSSDPKNPKILADLTTVMN